MSTGRSPGPRSGRLSPPASAVLVALFAVVAAAVLLLGQRGSGTATTSPQVSANGSQSSRSHTSTGAAVGVQNQPATTSSLRTKAEYVLSVIDATGQVPSGYVGGRQFMNDGRGGTTALPRTSSGSAITYREYDVNPKVNGINRGPQRLIIGSDGSAYVTGDHYLTWGRLR